MANQLQQMLEQVTDERSFLVFVDALLNDRISDVAAQKGRPLDDFGPGPKGWVNQTLVDFLDAAKAWGESTDMGATEGLENASPWRRCAALLYAGKVFNQG